jgi:two-component system LytT family sensor kinase
MKKLIIFLTLFAAVNNAKAQVGSNKNVIRYYLASSSNADLKLDLNVDSNTKWIDYANILPNRPLDSYTFLHGTKKIIINAIPRLRQSLKNYRYNVIQDDSIYLVTNAIIDGARGKSRNRTEIILGEFDVHDKKLTIETYDVTQRHKVSTATIYNKAFKPAEILMTSRWVLSKRGSGTIANNLEEGLNYAKTKRLSESFTLKINNGDETVNGIEVAIKEADLIFTYHTFIKKLSTGKMLPVSNNWLYGGLSWEGTAVPHLMIDASFFSEPGDYEIVIVPQLPTMYKPQAFLGKATTLRFTVLPSDTKYSVKNVLFIAMGIVILAAIAIFYVRRNAQKQLIAQQKEKDLAEVQLSAVRSQLNPHFLFNALAGIQNLMNKNEVDQANRYLTKFARLTRNVLKSNELINITDEVALLNDYLQMEQLRFGFRYHIETDKTIDADNTEIPAMLLQPFVENAVKHGIAAMGADGKINIEIKREVNSLVLLITDNGKGFDTQTTAEGLGIQLSQRRVALLNKIYTQAPVLLDIQSGANGTKITLTLTQWL